MNFCYFMAKKQGVVSKNEYLKNIERKKKKVANFTKNKDQREKTKI